MHSDWKNICTSAKALITKQTNNSAMKIFSCLFLESKFSAFWPNSIGLISKTITSIYPKFCTELAKCVNYKNVLGIFFYLRGSGEILQKLPVIDAKQQFQLCNSIKKVSSRLNENRWNIIVNQFSFILMEYKLCRGINWFLRRNFTMKTCIFETRGSNRFRLDQIQM